MVPFPASAASNPHVESGFGGFAVRLVSRKGNGRFDSVDLHADPDRIPGYGDDLADNVLLLVPPNGGVMPEMVYRKVPGRDLGRPRW